MGLELGTGLLLPNSCKVPNIILDEVMRKVSHAEFKVLMTKVSRPQVIRALKALSWILDTYKTK